MDYRQALGEGIIGAGAAAVVGLVTLIFRWTLLGLRSDLGRLAARRKEKRLEKKARQERREPPLTR
jgi:hypothetical protein